jgi:hypothetical protein
MIDRHKINLRANRIAKKLTFCLLSLSAWFQISAVWSTGIQSYSEGDIALLVKNETLSVIGIRNTPISLTVIRYSYLSQQDKRQAIFYYAFTHEVFYDDDDDDDDDVCFFFLSVLLLPLSSQNE